MSESTRHSVLASRHRALGSELEDWNGMGTAWTYASDPCAEHDAVREAAGLFDMSPLKKVYLRGPDALKVADHVITRDMTGIYPGKSAYGAILTPQGTVCDDAIIANNGDDEWLFCHGSGDSMAYLQESAEGLNVSTFCQEDDVVAAHFLGHLADVFENNRDVFAFGDREFGNRELKHVVGFDDDSVSGHFFGCVGSSVVSSCRVSGFAAAANHHEAGKKQSEE